MFADLNWTAFLIALIIVEITPGPNMGWLATLSARSGFRAGIRAVAGVTLGLTIQMLAAALGLAAILASSAPLYEVLRWSGVAFMLYLAWETWSEESEPSPGQAHGSENFYRGLIANLLNPKALIFYLAVVGQFVDPERGQLWLQTMVLGSIHLVVSLLIHVAIVFAGARMASGLERWRTSIAVRAGFAFLLVMIAIWIAISTAR